MYLMAPSNCLLKINIEDGGIHSIEETVKIETDHKDVTFVESIFENVLPKTGIGTE